MNHRYARTFRILGLFLSAAALSCTNASPAAVSTDDAGEPNFPSDTDSRADTGDTEREPWQEEIIDPAELPVDIPVVELRLSEDARASLETSPFYGDDVVGTFIDADGVQYDNVDINFRGAYALADLLDNDPEGRRNWKVKFEKVAMYRNRREWNFNFEPELRQKLAMDLMKFAGVKVPSARHVQLEVNGEAMGLYLEYEDPDSKDWLYDKFGDDTGDLYKAATDLPSSEGEPEMKFFADTTYLGDEDGNYLYHYNKKTNHDDPAVANDFSVIRNFLSGVNETPDEEFAAWLEAHFDTASFLSYLAVSNFISNWDGFPLRPKNFWLYENRRTGKLVFIPWDMDATFQPWEDDFNQMGTEASVLFSLETLEYIPIHREEGDDRPLVFRMLAEPRFKAAYIEKYRALLDSILSEDYLQARLDALNDLTAPHLTDTPTGSGWMGDRTERTDYEDALADMRDFIAARRSVVAEELADLP